MHVLWLFFQGSCCYTETLSALRSILVQKYFVGEEVKSGVPFNRGGLSLSSDPAICHCDILTPHYICFKP